MDEGEEEEEQDHDQVELEGDEKKEEGTDARGGHNKL